MKKYCIVALTVLFVSTSWSQTHKYIEKPKFSGVPLLGYNKSFGWKLGVFAAVYFPVKKSDTLSPASVAGIGAMLTGNKSWFSFGFASLYYQQDTWRTRIAMGHGDKKFQFFNESVGPSGMYMNFNTVSDFLYVEQMYNVYKRWYTGLDATLFNATTTYDTPGSVPETKPYVAIGVPLTNDSRDNIQNPTKGLFANSRLNYFSKDLGSYSEYTKLDIDVSVYTGKNPKHIFAFKASVSTALGAVPFEAQTVIGGRVLRGYTDGKYRGDQVYVLQGEYRWNFYKRWGLVLFSGLATPVSKSVQWSGEDLLPSAGTGIRFMMVPELRANVGLDVAFGKQDMGVYVRFMEAF